MKPRLPHLTLLTAATTCLAGFTAESRAQVPEGWGIASATYRVNDALQVFSPRRNDPGIPLTGVPDEVRLTVGTSNGANSVAILPDGRVAVGNLAGQDRRAVVVYVLELTGFAVTTSRRIEVGRSFSSGGTITALQALADGRLIYSAQDLYAPASSVGSIDPATGIVRPLPIGGLPGRNFNAIAISDDESEVYVGVWTSPSSGSVWRAPLAGGSASLVANTPHGVTSLDVDNGGNLLVGMNNAAEGLAYLEVATGNFVTVPGTPRNVGALVCERTTGAAMFVHAAFPNAPGSIARLLPGGASPTAIANVNTGRTSGLDLRESPRVYGRASTAPNAPTWQTRPNPGGMPLLGNTGFSLTVDAGNTSAGFAMLLIAPERASVQILGLDLLVDPARATALPMVGRTMPTAPLPIPDLAGLVGVRLHAQALLMDPVGQLRATAGLTFGPIAP